MAMKPYNYYDIEDLIRDFNKERLQKVNNVTKFKEFEARLMALGSYAALPDRVRELKAEYQKQFGGEADLAQIDELAQNVMQFQIFSLLTAPLYKEDIDPKDNAPKYFTTAFGLDDLDYPLGKRYRYHGIRNVRDLLSVPEHRIIAWYGMKSKNSVRNINRALEGTGLRIEDHHTGYNHDHFLNSTVEELACRNFFFPFSTGFVEGNTARDVLNADRDDIEWSIKRSIGGNISHIISSCYVEKNEKRCLGAVKERINKVRKRFERLTGFLADVGLTWNVKEDEIFHFYDQLFRFYNSEQFVN